MMYICHLCKFSNDGLSFFKKFKLFLMVLMKSMISYTPPLHTHSLSFSLSYARMNYMYMSYT